MNIKVSEPDGPYHVDLDTGVMEVEIRNAFIGASFITEEGERLNIFMRDGGFEFTYSKDGQHGEKPFKFAGGSMNDGKVIVRSRNAE